MTSHNDRDNAQQRLSDILRAAIPPVSDAEPQRDLWPLLIRRINESQPSRLHVPWFDWALLGALAAAMLLFPALIPALLYHL